MSYMDDKQHLMEDIAEEPARFLMEQFDEGNIFYDKEWQLNAYTLEDLPVIMRLENADNIYLTATTWWLVTQTIEGLSSKPTLAKMKACCRYH